jgi:hypothetical protein
MPGMALIIAETASQRRLGAGRWKALLSSRRRATPVSRSATSRDRCPPIDADRWAGAGPTLPVALALVRGRTYIDLKGIERLEKMKM